MEGAYDNNISQENNANKCLIDVLSKLKESSLEAVESSKKLNELTKYMHVIRPVQNEFEDIIKSASMTDKAELVLLCGSVGDGKSHLLSYYNENHPELMSSFQIHNDSTASFYINKPAIYTLKEVLNDFKDSMLKSSNKKLILAINLGTLNNFLDNDIDNDFWMLRNFIEDMNILNESVTIASVNEVASNFHYVNFADYHLYSLAETTPTSLYIDSLLLKLVSNTIDNPFINEYNSCCKSCLSYKVCPVRANYEMISNTIFRRELIQVIIESVVKNKLIISTRALLNFFYEMIVDERFIRIGSMEPRKEIFKLNAINYCKALLPNSIFSRVESSNAINSMKQIDPIDVRNENVDTFIVEFTNKEDVFNVFTEYIPEAVSYLYKIADIDFSENCSLVLKQELLKLFIRLYRLFDKQNLFIVKDPLYYEYMRNLYYWNCGEKVKLREAYNMVKQAALNWNGSVDGDEMIIPTSSLQIQHKLSQKVYIKQSLDNVINRKELEVERFVNGLFMEYQNLKNEEKYQIEVDFSLYSLLRKIVEGYRPNMKDKSINVKFSNFVDYISQKGSKDETIYIKEKSINYKLEYSPDFGYTFEVV